MSKISYLWSHMSRFLHFGKSFSSFYLFTICSCKGIADEKICLPCLEEDCPIYGILFNDGVSVESESVDNPLSDYATTKTQNVASDFCNICWIDDLASAPSILLPCGHVFHHHVFVFDSSHL
jgi:hypothetical protein